MVASGRERLDGAFEAVERVGERSTSRFQEILLDAGRPVLLDLFVDCVIDRDIDLVRGGDLRYGAGRRSPRAGGTVARQLDQVFGGGERDPQGLPVGL
jgi:hypothetical protein